MYKRQALKSDDVEKIKSAQEELQKKIFALSERIYKESAAQQQNSDAAGANNANAAGGAGDGSNVYDANYEDVDKKDDNK